jgi:hypothetical protein
LVKTVELLDVRRSSIFSMHVPLPGAVSTVRASQ